MPSAKTSNTSIIQTMSLPKPEAMASVTVQ